MNKLAHLISYHNGVPLLFGLLFLFSGVAFAASPDAREAVIGTETEEVVGIDNTAIIDADLASFDIDVRIEQVRADDENYFVDYSYRTITLIEHTWEETRKENTLVVSKRAVQGDIKMYAIQELREVARGELAYLVRVQEAERAAGRQTATVVKAYSGLTGFAVGLTDALLPPKRPPVMEEPPRMEEPEPVSEEQEEIETPAVPPEAPKEDGEGEMPPTEPEVPVEETVQEPPVPAEEPASEPEGEPSPEVPEE